MGKEIKIGDKNATEKRKKENKQDIKSIKPRCES